MQKYYSRLMRDKYEAVIGLEVHCQLSTESKIFCSCSTRFGDEPNANTCPVCLGLPGALPVLNARVVELATRVALALNLRVNAESIFARKNYFYPDLPKGYQISQYKEPFSEDGWVEIATSERDATGHPLEWVDKRFRITRMHLEEDAGKSLHDGMPDSDTVTYVDLNRSGMPLVEIVSEPDFRTSWEAYDYVQYLRRTLQYLDASDANMEEGNLRCDANVSVRLRGQQTFGTKVELKNLNSVRFLQRALEYEINRQIEVIERGGSVVQETRLYNDRENRTYTMRTKEEAHDYRYFPEPDLPPLRIDLERVERMRAELPELPEAVRRRFMAQYGLSHEDASVLTASRAIAFFVEQTAGLSGNPRATANWVRNEVLRELEGRGREIFGTALTPERLATLIKALDRGEVSGAQAKEMLPRLMDDNASLAELIEQAGGGQINDEAAIRALVQQAIDANPKQLAQYRAGKEALFGFFVGQVMKLSDKKANAKLTNDLLKEMLTAGEL
jgi:aspartyl-tRNA(Asn)/glutamyl-tRNA(Gln) amidotransferase subunit B